MNVINNDRNLYVFILFIRLMDTAREMIKESLPIKCLEAVIVGLYPLQKEAIALILQVHLLQNIGCVAHKPNHFMITTKKQEGQKLGS